MTQLQGFVDPVQVLEQIEADERWWADLTEKERNDIQFKYRRALFQLIYHFPFFGFMATRLSANTVWIKNQSQFRGIGGRFKTMATDGKAIYVWPQYVLYNPIEAVMGTIIHELFHVIFLHIGRGKGYNQQLANIAMDLVVNMMVNDLAKEVKGVQKTAKLDNNLYQSLPWYVGCPPAFHDEKYRDAKTGDPWVWEKVYQDLLSQQDPDMQKQLSAGACCSGLKGIDPSGSLHDDHSFWEPEQRPEDEEGNRNQDKFDPNDARDMVRDAHVQTSNAKMAGKMPASMERLIKEWLHPPLPWQRLVQKYLKPAPGDFGYQPGDLRFADPMPWFIPEQKLDYIVVSIDTSGSMSDQEVGSAITQARHLLKSFPQTKGILCMCDAEVGLWQPLEETYRIDRRVGYGGTSFAPPFEKIMAEKLGDKVVAHIYFTDGYGWFPDADWLKQHKIQFDTLWVITNKEIDPPKHPQYNWTRLSSELARQR